MQSISFSMIFDYIAMAWSFAVDSFMSFFAFFLRPYVTLYKFAKVFFQNCVNLILITHLSIHATLLYLKMSVRILSRLDKRFNDVAATNSLMYIERVSKAIYKKILDESRDGTVPAIMPSSNVPGTKSITFSAVTESGESSSNTGGSDSAASESSPRDSSSSVDSPSKSEPHQGASPSRPSSENNGGSGTSGGNGSSNGVTNSGTNDGGNSGGNSGRGDAPMTGKAETKSPTKPSTTGSGSKAPTGGSSGVSSHASSSGSTTASDSSFRTAETDGGVDEVDKSKSAKTARTATPTGGGGSAIKSPAAPVSGGSTTGRPPANPS